jgi:LAGLIDADG endonuclease
LFLALHKYLGVGNIIKNRNNITLVVTSIDEIIKVIIPLFDKSCLYGSKLSSYQIFREISLMMKDKKHLTLEGTLQIIELAYFMNKETSLRTEFTKQELLNKIRNKYGMLPFFSRAEPAEPKINFSETKNSGATITLEFIRGLIDGDGSFNVNFRTERRRIGVNFTVVSELSSISVLNDLIKYFKCGSVYKLPSSAARYQVQTVDEILNLIAPIFNNIKFNTLKQTHFEKTIKVCELIKTKGYKTDEDLKTIVNLAWDMNKSGKNRKISKDQYLSKFTGVQNK